jgi:hypothetical protein
MVALSLFFLFKFLQLRNCSLTFEALNNYQKIVIEPLDFFE